MGKGSQVVSFWRGGGLGFLVIILLISRLLFDLLFTCRLKDVVSFIFLLSF